MFAILVMMIDIFYKYIRGGIMTVYEKRFCDITEQMILESGFSRIMSIVSGLVPSVRTFAIITWENPHSKNISNEENEKRNNKLKELLDAGYYGYKQIVGNYGHPENPYFIMNISRAAAIHYGNMGEQTSIVYAEVNGKFDIVYYEIFMDIHKPMNIRHVWKNTNRDEYYSEIKGRRFYIPFYDDTNQEIRFKSTGKGVFSTENYDDITIRHAENISEKIVDDKYTGKLHYQIRGELNLLLSRTKKL